MPDEFLVHSALLDKLLLEFEQQAQFPKEIQNLIGMKGLVVLDIRPGDYLVQLLEDYVP